MPAEFFTVRAGGTYLSNEVIQNQAIAPASLGLLMRMLSMPEKAPKTRETLMETNFGRTRVENALRNLEEVNLRFRFLACMPGNVWKTAVVLSDHPLTVEEALTSVRSDFRPYVTACSSHDVEMTSGKQAVATGSTNESYPQADDDFSLKTHRRQKTSHREKEGTESYPQPDGRFSDRRRTRHPISKEISNNSSLRSELKPSQPAINEPEPAKSLAGIEDHSPQPSDADPSGRVTVNWDRINHCLPKTLVKLLDPSATRRVDYALERALALGWTERRIYDGLNHDPLPDTIRNPPGLVVHRVNEFLITEPESPKTSVTAANQTKTPTPPSQNPQSPPPLKSPDQIRSEIEDARNDASIGRPWRDKLIPVLEAQLAKAEGNLIGASEPKGRLGADTTNERTAQ